MSFQDIEAGLARPSSISPQLHEDSTFLSLQLSLSLQVFKINSNVGAILARVDQLGTTKDSANLRKSLYSLLVITATQYSIDYSEHRRDLTETTRAIAKQGSDDLKKLASMAVTNVNIILNCTFLSIDPA
jgi:hypothetical protein